MIADSLKKALLQAAIQGKLTEQLPEDGDARDLIKEIQKEKARLIKEGKIKKQKPLPEIKEDEIPFDIPENWVWVRLGEIGTWSAGATPLKSNRKYYDNGTIPWLKTGDLNDNLIFDIPDFVTEKALKETSLKIQPKGTVLIAMYGATIGKLGLLEIEATTNQACCGCNPYDGVLNFYLFYFLMSHKQDFINQGAGGAQPNISREKIVGNPFPLPPLLEQKRIVKKIEELLPEIEALKEGENKLDDLEKAFPGKIRASILQAAIQGKLTEQLPEDGDARDLLKDIQKEKARLIKEGKIKKQKPLPAITEDEILFDIPENWVWVRLGDYVDFKIGRTPSRGESSYWGNDIPWVSISDMNDQPVINHTKEKISNKAFNKVFKGNISPKGTLLMSFKLTIGRMSFLGMDALHNEAIISITPIIKNPITDNYLFKVLPFFAQTGETKGAIKGETLNSSSIRRLLFPLAPLSEQDRIIQKLDELLPLCTSVETTSY